MSEEGHSQGGETERRTEAGPGAQSEAGGPAEVSQAEAGGPGDQHRQGESHQDDQGGTSKTASGTIIGDNLDLALHQMRTYICKYVRFDIHLQFIYPKNIFDKMTVFDNK